ncbi:MAG: LCP family protein [bacterium]
MARPRRARWWLLIVPAAALAIISILLLPDRRRPAGAAGEPAPTGSINILIIGRDARALGPVVREGRQRNPREKRSHSDVVIIARANLDLGRVALYGIPRDLLVEVPGITRAADELDFENMEKLTHVHAIGGQALLRRTLERLLGITIDRHIAFDFDTFRMALSLLRPFLAGLRLDGVPLADRERALQLARRRDGLPADDIDRSRNNVRIVAAVLARTWWLADTRAGGLLADRLLDIVGEDTDLTPAELRGLALALKRVGFEPSRTRTAVLAGSGMDVHLNRYSTVLSCYLPAYPEMRRQVRRFLADDDTVEAVAFITDERFPAPGYLFEPRPAPPADTAPADTAALRTVLMEMRRAGLAPDSGN